ncbi:kinase-like protein [Xylariaceae sp. FL1019]|nr:kinase-like protein [Xylariaceae sp. FL1019]
MSQDCPAPFALAPLNSRAVEVLKDNCNSHFLAQYGDQAVLQIGLVGSNCKDTYKLATLGRDGDIVTNGATISALQCSFGINPDSGFVMFYDDSRNQSSQVFGENSTPFEHGRARKAVVHENCNRFIGFGGVHRDMFLFELIWHKDAADISNMVKERKAPVLRQNPRFARTIDLADTLLNSRMETRIHTQGPRNDPLRYLAIDDLGAGGFGRVIRAVNVATGSLMAVKIVQSYHANKREIEILSGLQHDHIIEYIGFQTWGEVWVKAPSKCHSSTSSIFMGLQDGTLASLVLEGEPHNQRPNENGLAWKALEHILQALDFLATRNIVHRDIKPENILYVKRDGNYNFKLGDFGVSNSESQAQVLIGTLLYIAPEILRGQRQTHKADVWSLYVTILWTSNVRNFREESPELEGNLDHLHEFIQSCAGDVKEIQEMARDNPEERASAAQMLVKCFGGHGLYKKDASKVPKLITDGETPDDASKSVPSISRRSTLTDNRLLLRRGGITKPWAPGRRRGAASAKRYKGSVLRFLKVKINEDRGAAAETGAEMDERMST